MEYISTCSSNHDDLQDTEDEETLDVLDLPQLYQKPSTTTLLSTLTDLTLAPPSWDATPSKPKRKVKSEGIPAYLTRIISSPLLWIEDDAEKERIWEAAAQRLSERSGRTGMGDLKRTFRIPLQRQDGSTNEVENNLLEIILHEPALQEDNLGLKTWASSYLLAKRLVTLRTALPTLPPESQILELGAGTGLVGLAAAAIFKAHVVLTDLPEIVSNLARNIAANNAALTQHQTKAQAAVLDWSQPASLTLDSSAQISLLSFPLILVADPIYSSSHPRLLVQTITSHLSTSADARVVIELPLREAYVAERRDLRERMALEGLRVLDEGEELGFDDWVDGGDGRVEVRCWWSVWGWAS